MVAVIKTGYSIHRIFNYNENKVKEGVAKCMGVGNYPLDADKMTVNMKLNRLLKQLELNTNVRRNSVHISLNFHVSENHFPKEKLMAIAEDYMEKIGFGEQPYLVYQHHDAAHPHLHVVSIKIRPDGSRIDMNNIGRNQSEKARKSIEKAFNLVKAETQQKQQSYRLKPVSVTKAFYGKSETKRAIQNVLDKVIGAYKFTSLPELNVILRQYNVLAERGSEGSRVFQNNGLLYRILDGEGNPIGVPIKASLFYSKPTLAVLQEKFKGNEAKRLPYKARIKTAIDFALLNRKPTIPELVSVLGKEGIHVALRQNDAGLIYGITYVDHQTQCVFNGSALGKQYSAKAIQERCMSRDAFEQKASLGSTQKQAGLQPPPANGMAETRSITNAPAGLPLFTGAGKVLGNLMEAEQVSDYMPHQLKKAKKKKKRKNLKQ